MDAKVVDAGAQNNGYEPPSDLIKEQDCDTLLVYLPGFKKEQLRVQLVESGNLRVSGTRPIGLGSFQKDYPLSPNCDTTNITAKFEGGILYVSQPKLKTPVLETQQAQSHIHPLPPTPIPSRLNKDKEKDRTEKTSSSEAQIKQESAAGFRPKSDTEVTKPVEEGKASEPEDGENEKTGTVYVDQRAGPSIIDQPEEFSGNSASEFAKKLTGKVGKDRLDYYKLVAAGTAAKVRKSGKIIYMATAIILAFAFGMYINNLIWCSRKPEN